MSMIPTQPVMYMYCMHTVLPPCKGNVAEAHAMEQYELNLESWRAYTWQWGQL